MSDAATRDRLMESAIRAIEHAVGTASTVADPVTGEEVTNDTAHHGVFVTVYVRDELRGCIGYLDPGIALTDAVGMAAAGAAVHDPRFESVHATELPDVAIEISLLGPRERIHHAEQIDIGRHGIMLEYGYARGLLLPQVAASHEWDAPDFLRALCRKAGVPAHIWKDQEARVFRFTTVVHRRRFTDHRSMT